MEDRNSQTLNTEKFQTEGHNEDVEINNRDTQINIKNEQKDVGKINSDEDILSSFSVSSATICSSGLKTIHMTRNMKYKNFIILINTGLIFLAGTNEINKLITKHPLTDKCVFYSHFESLKKIEKKFYKTFKKHKRTLKVFFMCTNLNIKRIKKCIKFYKKLLDLKFTTFYVFTQDLNPVYDINDIELYTSKTDKILRPNGTGGLFLSIIKNKMIPLFRKLNIHILNVVSIHNIKAKLFDLKVIENFYEFEQRKIKKDDKVFFEGEIHLKIDYDIILKGIRRFDNRVCSIFRLYDRRLAVRRFLELTAEVRNQSIHEQEKLIGSMDLDIDMSRFYRNKVDGSDFTIKEDREAKRNEQKIYGKNCILEAEYINKFGFMDINSYYINLDFLEALSHTTQYEYILERHYVRANMPYYDFRTKKFKITTTRNGHVVQYFLFDLLDYSNVARSFLYIVNKEDEYEDVRFEEY